MRNYVIAWFGISFSLAVRPDEQGRAQQQDLDCCRHAACLNMQLLFTRNKSYQCGRCQGCMLTVVMCTGCPAPQAMQLCYTGFSMVQLHLTRLQ